ncbi:spinster family MFS transporter [Flavisphingomonas formosensis]|uniref:spinster family MFS transporter n=1 Tax=Flavisphingomonas formosensis TaxID=861534 RepID=UPI0018DF54A3|nr:MFS transporter [Sphingomonas formosensis]
MNNERDPQAERQRLRRGWYVVGLCMVAYVFSFIDRQILSLLIGPIKADLGISDTQFGLLSGLAFSIFYATMGVPIAGLADRMSRPAIIAAGIAFWSMATIACGFARGFGQLFAARIGVGAGEAALSPATYSLIADLFPREKLGRAIAVYSLGSFLGAGLAFLVGGAAIALVGAGGDRLVAGVLLKPWQLVFLLVGAPGVLLALLVFLTVKEPLSADERNAVGAVPRFSAVLRFLWRERAIFGPHIAGFTCAAMALFALLGWSPAYLMRSFGLTPAQSGLWLGCIALLAGGGGVLTSGWMMDRMAARGHRDAPFRTGIVGVLGTVVPAALLPAAGSLWGGTTLLGIALFFASFPMPPSTAVMQLVAPARMRSRVSALFLCSNSLIGLSVGSLLVGLFNDRLFTVPSGIAASLALVVTVASLGGAGLLALGRRPYTR